MNPNANEALVAGVKNPYRYARNAVWTCALALWATASVSVAAVSDNDDVERLEGNSLQIVTAAFGLERFKEHTANQNALGVGFARIFGVEASYFDLGDSKHAGRQAGEDGSNDNIGGRIDLRVAFDVSAPLTQSTRLFSRMGVYYWDLDVNFNRATHDLAASQGGNGQVVSVGAAYDARSVRLSLELEQVDRQSVISTRDTNRVLFNLSSKF